MVLVERDSELRQLDRLLEECFDGRGRVALIEGATGSGKTELLRYAAARAQNAGMMVRSANCASSEAVLRFGVVNQLLYGAGIPAETTQRILRRPLAEDPETDGAADLAHVLHELGLILLDLSARQPLLITVDDVQYADELSLAALLHLVRRLDSARIVVLLAGSLASRPLDVPFRVGLTRSPGFRSLRLAPLSLTGATELVARQSDEVTARRLAPALHEATAGNPLLLTALTEDFREVGGARTEGFGLALLACLHRGEPILIELARALAVLEAPMPHPRAVDLPAVPPAPAGGGLADG
ncbi:ATPase, partial [Parafrankia sp. EUN1f]